MSSPLTIQFTRPPLEIDCTYDTMIRHYELTFIDDRPDWTVQFQHSLESLYADLPWPKNVKNIAVVTEVADGSGDVSSAAKVVDAVRKLSSDLNITWRVCSQQFDPKTFLSSSDLSKIHIITDLSEEKPNEPADLLITGPVNTVRSLKEMKILYRGEIRGPRFNFIEFGHVRFTTFSKLVWRQQSDIRGELTWPLSVASQMIFGRPVEKTNSVYQTIHANFFVASHDLPGEGVVMGLRNKTGVLIDEKRAHAFLSRKSCCPNYLQNIGDDQLKRDVLQSLGVANGEGLPNYDQVCLSFGYARRSATWKRFISLIAIQEQEKDVVIVLNQTALFDSCQYTTDGFCRKIFTPDFLSFLEKYGFGQVRVKGVEEEPIVMPTGNTPDLRTLDFVIRPNFTPGDVMAFQLASDRLLCTGDNTPLESWAARCSLYLYECQSREKELFLKQQVEAAKPKHPIFARYLQLTSKRGDFTEAEMNEVIALLRDPQLPQQTLAFCKEVVIIHSFKNVLVGALKRAAWHHLLPNLLSAEAEAIDLNFKEKVITCLQSFYWYEYYTQQELNLMLHNIQKKISSTVMNQTSLSSTSAAGVFGSDDKV